FLQMYSPQQLGYVHGQRHAAAGRRYAPDSSTPAASARGASMEKPSALFERKDPFNQCLEIGVGNVVGRHRNRAPDAAAAFLDFLLEPGERRGVGRVLCGDIFICRSDEFLVHAMTCLTVV